MFEEQCKAKNMKVQKFQYSLICAQIKCTEGQTALSEQKILKVFLSLSDVGRNLLHLWGKDGQGDASLLWTPRKNGQISVSEQNFVALFDNNL